MPNEHGLTQYLVKWDDQEFLLYAKNLEDARFQVRAPAHAVVEESHLTRRDIERYFSGSNRP